jgi:hypothetical protein
MITVRFAILILIALVMGCTPVELCTVIHHDLTHVHGNPLETPDELEEGLRPRYGVYMAEIELGSPPQTLAAIVDTGSSNLVITGPDCTNCESVDYDPSQSSSASTSGDPFSITYGSGALNALRYTDTAGLPCGEDTAVEFGLATSAQGVGSILGLAYQALAHPASSPIKPWFATMVDKGILENLFSMRLCGTQKSGSHIKFGGFDEGIDPTQVKYTPLIKETYYVISNPTFSIKGVAINSATSSTTIVDSGTTLLLVPADIHTAIQSQLETVATQAGLADKFPTNFWGVNAKDISVRAELSDSDVASFPAITVTVPSSSGSGDLELDVTPQTYFRKTSTGAYYFGIRPGSNLTTLGQVFMENFTVIFDRANTQIGFAPITGCGD